MSFVKKNRIETNKLLLKKLYEFQKFNPNFGRKIYKMKTIYTQGKCKKVKSHFEFITNHKKFVIYDIKDFMNDHLEYKYDNYQINSSINQYVQVDLQQLMNANNEEDDDEENHEEDEYEEDQYEEDENDEDQYEEDEYEENESIS